ncbi:hypothetical protein C495_01020, partial [Natronorubrum sulfidifaciens JCM 14089]
MRDRVLPCFFVAVGDFVSNFADVVLEGLSMYGFFVLMFSRQEIPEDFVDFVDGGAVSGMIDLLDDHALTQRAEEAINFG